MNQWADRIAQDYRRAGIDTWPLMIHAARNGLLARAPNFQRAPALARGLYHTLLWLDALERVPAAAPREA